MVSQQAKNEFSVLHEIAHQEKKSREGTSDFHLFFAFIGFETIKLNH